ncbi:MAG: hypothetical protein DI527_18895 [Chelatococcus sp.]|nr:MAG: hypothetical protein DI527_18895 [Chelatococcus sp.]
MKGDPGERAYGILRSEGLTPTVWLDGVDQKLVVTADVEAGFVRRLVTGPSGNIATDAAGDVLEEDVFGKVVITVG